MKFFLRSSSAIIFLACISYTFANATESGKIEALITDNVTLTRRRKVKSCNLVDFTGYNKPNRCCQQPPVDSYDLSAIAGACNNGETFDSGYFFEYKFNRLLSPRNHFSIKWDSKKQITKAFAAAACVGACGASFLGLLNADGTTNGDLLGTFLATVAPLAWKPVILEAIGECRAPLDLLKNIKVTLYEKEQPPRECPVSPMMFIQCIHAYLIGRCPSSLQLTIPSSKCLDEIEGLDKCNAMFDFPPLLPSSNESN